MPAPLPDNEADRLVALRRYQILDNAAEEDFDDITLIAAAICHTPIALMTLIDSERQWIKARVGLEVEETSREHAFCAHTILDEKVMVVEDALRDSRFSNNPLVTDAPGIRFYAGAPLIDHDGMALGCLCVIDRESRTFSAEEEKALQALARQVMSQLELRRSSADLAEALTNVKRLQGLLPICAHCKNIRNDTGYWQSVESYIFAHSVADLSHGICPACIEEHFPEVFAKLRDEGSLENG